MRKRVGLILLISIAVLISGCIGNKSGKISLKWRYLNAGSEVRSETINGIELSREALASADTILGSTWLVVEASVIGRAQADPTFDFQIVSQNDYIIDGNKVTITPKVAEDGYIHVVSGDLELTSPFKVYPSAVLGSEFRPKNELYTHFDFSESLSNNEYGDVYMVSGSMDIWATYGYATMPRNGGFWGDFLSDTDFESLKYEIGSFTFEHDKIYCIKTTNGYAKMMFKESMSGSSIHRHSFVYDYYPAE